MKNIILLLSAFLTFMSCNAQKKNSTSAEAKASTKNLLQKIVLEEITRGRNQTVAYTATAKEVTINGKKTTEKMSSSEWEQLRSLLSKINLKEIKNYPSPTTDRFFDGALASTIKITYNGEIYESQSFDSGRPPVQLAEFYKKIASVFTKTR